MDLVLQPWIISVDCQAKISRKKWERFQVAHRLAFLANHIDAKSTQLNGDAADSAHTSKFKHRGLLEKASNLIQPVSTTNRTRHIRSPCHHQSIAADSVFTGYTEF
jgi:hypothetical protein